MELVGNCLCLDFANTVARRPEGHGDRLTTMDGLLTWAQAAGVLPPDFAGGGGVALGDAIELRESVYRTFSAVAARRHPDPDDVSVIMNTYAEALCSASLHREGDGHVLRWPGERSARAVLWPVAASAGRLLLEGPLNRVGECPSCGWLFLDTTRNGSRRWCSMAMCGNQVKSRRYYAAKTTHRGS
ncbi:CGNR zinc finger domain-containing protein [Nonomuraea harbinensis]|uniref:CGNR zinc finger domain-containing protein n=1 Tax=Nonomuraea harbinensis TaxID=1286938 RepID=A0ABW1C8M8_9ACTN|nr:ABATE domain-containing protein [Nonomuraea harbinensis]